MKKTLTLAFLLCLLSSASYGMGKDPGQSCPECPKCPDPIVCPPVVVCPDPVVCPEVKPCPSCPPPVVCQPCPSCPVCPACPTCPVCPPKYKYTHNKLSFNYDKTKTYTMDIVSGVIKIYENGTLVLTQNPDKTETV